MTRQRAYQLRHRALGLCERCPKQGVLRPDGQRATLCRRHLVGERERMRRKTGWKNDGRGRHAIDFGKMAREGTMTRDEIARLLENAPDYIDLCDWQDEIIEFAVAIHDAVKEEDASRCDAHQLDTPDELAERIRASKVNK